MAVGAWVIPDKAKLHLTDATFLAGLTAGNYRLALVSSAWTPTNASDELWSVASGSEIAGGTGYTTGGIALSTTTLNQTSGTVKFTFTVANPTWTASGGGIAAWRRCVLYYLGTVNSLVNPILAHFLGDSTPADIPLTTAGNTITITASGSGVLTIA
jgi:hypothetical protein